VKGQYRSLTPEERADHIAALALLGRMVLVPPAPPLHWRRFVVVIGDPER